MKLLVHISQQTLDHFCSSNGLFTLTDTDSDPHSIPIPLVGSLDGNLNLTPCNLKSCAYYNVAIWFTV